MTDPKKTVVKVSINCERCKKDVLQAVTKLCGINQVSTEADKGTLTVIGTVDPVLIVKQLRKAGKFAVIESVGPPKPPEPPKPDCIPVLPLCCNDCQYVGGFGYSSIVYDDGPRCIIL